VRPWPPQAGRGQAAARGWCAAEAGIHDHRRCRARPMSARPARTPGGSDIVGNWVNKQFQLDAFGEALLLFAAPRPTTTSTQTGAGPLERRLPRSSSAPITADVGNASPANHAWTRRCCCRRSAGRSPPQTTLEGAFRLCGFLMALAYSQQGDRITAARWFERNRSACGPPGLCSEEFDVAQRHLRCRAVRRRSRRPQAGSRTVSSSTAASAVGS